MTSGESVFFSGEQIAFLIFLVKMTTQFDKACPVSLSLMRFSRWHEDCYMKNNQTSKGGTNNETLDRHLRQLF